MLEMAVAILCAERPLKDPDGVKQTIDDALDAHKHVRLVPTEILDDRGEYVTNLAEVVPMLPGAARMARLDRRTKVQETE